MTTQPTEPTVPSTPPAGQPAPNPPSTGVSAPAGGTTPPAAPSGDAGKTFTQADLDRIINDRLAKERKTFEQQIEEAKATAGKSDLEAAQIKLQQTEGKLTEVTQAAAQRIAKTEAKVAAVTAGAKTDRIAAVIAQADLTDAITDDGDVDEAKVAAAIEKVLTDFPEWKAETIPGKSGGELSGGGPGGKPTFTRKQIADMSQEERLKRIDEINDALADNRVTG